MDISEIVALDSAKERFMSNQAMYERFLFQFPERTIYQELKEQLQAENVEEAFQVAHKMKGVVENLSLHLLGGRIREVVEALRGGELPAQRLVEELDEAYERSVQGIAYIKENHIQLFE